MNTRHSWVTPFVKQCYVTVGVSLNILNHGLVSGFSAVLLPQLRAPDSLIKVDKTSESWIASVFAVSFLLGIFILSVILDKLGRKTLNLISITVMALGWYMTVWASSVTSLIISRTIQGFSQGISAHLCPIMIGEYTSPRHRGTFLATLSLGLSCGILATHTLGSYLRWQTTALICAIIVTIDFLIVYFSPESPVWLINKGRYEEGKMAYRWLRGLTEEGELTRMIQENMEAQSQKRNEIKPFLHRFLNKLDNIKGTVVKEEFYKPNLIVIHLCIIVQWAGGTILTQFTPDIFYYVVGNINVSTMTVALAVHRVVSGIYMMIIMDKFKRRTMVISLITVAVFSLLSIAGYAYARPRNILPFDHPAIGIVLIHIQMVSVCSGCMGVAFVIQGELFPLKYKGVAGGVSVSSVSINIFIMAKTAPYLLGDVGLPVAYCIYAGVVTYCMIIVVIFLPETQGKTLLDIENGFRKRRLEEKETCEPLTDF